MDHHRRVNAVEAVFFEHFDFAAAGFLGRRSEQDDMSGQSVFFKQRFRRISRCDRRRADEIMSASVSQFRQGVVFRDPCECGGAFAVIRPVGCFDSAVGRGDLKSELPQQFDLLSARENFPVCRFGMVPDCFREFRPLRMFLSDQRIEFLKTCVISHKIILCCLPRADRPASDLEKYHGIRCLSTADRKNPVRGYGL